MSGTSISPRRRATILLTAIFLLAIVAITALIAIRADKIMRWLAWPTPSPRLLPTTEAVWPTTSSLLVESLLPQIRLYAASP